MKRLVSMLAVLPAALLFVSEIHAQRQQHREYAEAKLSECVECHRTEGITPNHDSDWVQSHRTFAAKAGSNCSQCHTQGFCLDCHTGGGIDASLHLESTGKNYVPRSHRNDFMMRHPLKAQDNPQQCYRCHSQKTCTECHDRFPKGALRIKSHLMTGPNNQTVTWGVGEHAIEARRNLQSCQTCHPDGDVCVQCHSAKTGGKNPHPKNWGSVKDRYRSKGREQNCIRCHLPGTY